jgi:hypothetical protein
MRTPLIIATAVLTMATIGAPASFAGQREPRREREQARERRADRGGRLEPRRDNGVDRRRDTRLDVRRDGRPRRDSIVGGPGPRVYVAPRVVRPRVGRIVPYRPYVYRPSFRSGYAYGYRGYVYPPPGYLSVVPGRAYGGLRIEDAPQDAEVFADGYYVGIVDDFDNIFQHLTLEAGPHRIEIRASGYQPVVFDVRVVPGETITYHAGMR